MHSWAALDKLHAYLDNRHVYLDNLHAHLDNLQFKAMASACKHKLGTAWLLGLALHVRQRLCPIRLFLAKCGSELEKSKLMHTG